MKTSDYFVLLCFIVLVKACFISFFILYGEVGLGPDEAQYWTWSQRLDWGYYSKPPGIAWQIRAGTELFGNTEFGVRFGALLIGMAIPLATFFLAKASELEGRTAFWSGLTMAFIPLGVMASFLAITDGGLVLFWTLACIVLVNALRSQNPPNYYLLGFLIGCGALFKWPIYIIWLFAFALLFYFPKFSFLRLAGGVVISLIGLIPSFIWNVQHQWVTFRHVAGNITGTQIASEIPSKGNFFSFLGEQAILISPILFCLLVASFVYLVRNRGKIPLPIYFCGMVSFLIFVFYSLFAVFKKVQGNWCDFAYPTAIVFLCWYALEKIPRGTRYLQGGIALSGVLCVGALSIPYIQSHGLIPKFAIPYRFNPFRHNVGWNKLEEQLQLAGYNPEQNFLFSDKYQITSVLSFYTKNQKFAYFLNLQNLRQNQFFFWPRMVHQQIGQTGFFVAVENSPLFEKKFPKDREIYQHLLETYFKKVVFVGVFPLFSSQGKVLKAALIYKCIEYNGREPEKAVLY
jgi:4-amino-4-deoxy-L-arabinose transferase-like glycosyltransferase